MSRPLIYFLALFLPAVLVFKAIFLPGTLVSGDAPYLFTTGMREFLGNAQTWNEWGNVLGGVNAALWLYPINFLYGLIGMLGFGNDVSIRAAFFIPAIVLSLVSSATFARSLGFAKTTVVFTTLLYVLNTYFLLLLDGGQVGIALAYGLFPFVLLWVRKLLNRPLLNNFFIVLVLFNLLIHADVRVAAIALLAGLIWKLFEYIGERERPNNKSFIAISALLVLSALLNAYWIFPLVSLGAENLSTQVSGLQLTSLLNSLALFQPHWPANEFGNVSPPPFYFVLLPLIWIFGQMLSPSKKALPLVMTLLVFAFLAKGTTPPLGSAYEFFLEKVPFASLFRDSTKFFIPLILFSGLLMGETVELLSKHKNKLLSKVLPLGVYVYLLFLIYPALLGQLNGALSSKPLETDYQKIADHISRENDLFRTAWFTSKPPFAYHSNIHPAIDARYLANKKPIASLNVGSYDRFNFLTSPIADEWLELFNIKYLYFKPDEKSLNDEKQKEEWNALVSRVEENKEIKKVNWGLRFPAYELSNPKPRVFGKETATIVVGAQDVYEKLLEKNPNYDISNNLFFFAEDGLVNMNALLSTNPRHVSILLNDKSKLDLQMSLVKWLFPASAQTKSEWAQRSAGDYLRWKYEFLINGVDTKELDYGKGVSFSTVAGEKISFDLSSEPGEYVLAVRVLDKKGATPLKLRFNNIDLANDKGTESSFQWRIFPVKVARQAILEIENPGGFHAVNVATLVPKETWDNTSISTEDYLKHFKVTNIDKLAVLENPIENISFELKEPSIVTTEDVQPGWLVFSSTYDKNWQAYSREHLTMSLPAYSSFNSFYVPEASDVDIRYKGQDLLQTGLKISLVTLVILIIAFVGLRFKRKK